MKINYKKLAICIAIPLLVEAVSHLFTKDAMEQYYKLNQPPLSPPQWLFPVVWTILYILMGLSLYIVLEKGQKSLYEARKIFYFKLFINFMWSIFFFRFGWYLFSFFWLVFLWVMIMVMIRKFREISKAAAWMNIPQLLWIIFAGYLNLGIWWLNR